METILEFQNVSYAYHTLDGETPALSHISFSVKKGEFIAIVGPSGCGKSTLLSLIAGLLQPEEGQILIHGKSVELRNANIGYMLQKDHLFEWRSIYRNIILGLEIQHKLNSQTKEKANELLATYGLQNFAKAKPSELSGGMRQRAALIRTLVLDPDLLLLDEPFSALDYQTRLTVGDDIGQIIRKEKRQRFLSLTTYQKQSALEIASSSFLPVPPLFNRRSRFTLICRKILLFFAEIHRNLKHISILSGGN